MQAAIYGTAHSVRLLLAAGADIEARNTVSKRISIYLQRGDYKIKNNVFCFSVFWYLHYFSNSLLISFLLSFFLSLSQSFSFSFCDSFSFSISFSFTLYHSQSLNDIT